VDVFAGVGGFGLGFERAGYETAVVVENDEACRRVLAARFPHATQFGDVEGVTGDAIRDAVGGRRVNVLTGGFPCQDVSVAGRRGAFRRLWQRVEVLSGVPV
jgi:DNA (cytosine-5)-methyltransferase 1